MPGKKKGALLRVVELYVQMPDCLEVCLWGGNGSLTHTGTLPELFSLVPSRVKVVFLKVQSLKPFLHFTTSEKCPVDHWNPPPLGNFP